MKKKVSKSSNKKKISKIYKPVKKQKKTKSVEKVPAKKNLSIVKFLPDTSKLSVLHEIHLNEISPYIEEKDGVVTVYSHPNDNWSGKLPANMKNVQVIKDYGDYQSRYYIKRNNEPFDSTQGYIQYLGKILQYLQDGNAQQFFSNRSIEMLLADFELLKIKLEDQRVDKKEAHNILCTFQSFLNYRQFCKGTHDMHGNKRKKVVKVQFLSGLPYYKNKAA